MPLAISITHAMLFSPFLCPSGPSPIRLYATACRISWEKEAKLALTLTLMLGPLEVIAELVALGSKHCNKLVALYRRRLDALVQGLES